MGPYDIAGTGINVLPAQYRMAIHVQAIWT